MILPSKYKDSNIEGRKRIMAAILAAISAYLMEEPLSPVAANKANRWVMWGRSDAMRRRMLWQRRMTERSRLVQNVASTPGEGGARHDYGA